MIALERYTDTAKINVCNRKSGVLSVVKSNIKLSHKLNTKNPSVKIIKIADTV